jgi:predicted nucleic acid-binding protein
MTASIRSLRALVDTNIVVYAYDLDDPTKHTIARELLQHLSDEGRLIFSTQVINEFCSVMMRPSRKNPLGPPELAFLLRRLAATGQVVSITAATTFRALDAMPTHGLSDWGALICAAAAENGAQTLYTEDFQNGREIEGVRFVNPFQAAARAAPE